MLTLRLRHEELKVQDLIWRKAQPQNEFEEVKSVGNTGDDGERKQNVEELRYQDMNESLRGIRSHYWQSTE